MSVCPHVPRMMAASSGRISMKFDTGDFYEELSLISNVVITVQLYGAKFYILLTCIWVQFVLITKLTHFFNVFISLLCMFRATQCSSSGKSIVSIHHLVYITLCRRPPGMQVRDLHTRHIHTNVVHQKGQLKTKTLDLYGKHGDRIMPDTLQGPFYRQQYTHYTRTRPDLVGGGPVCLDPNRYKERSI